MKVFMTGGTGFVGTTLTQRLIEKGCRVTLLTRSKRGESSPDSGPLYVQGDPAREGDWQEKVPGHDVIINLAGAPIFGRWSGRYKKTIRDSRVLTTRNLVQALGGKMRAAALLTTSAVGYYGFHGDEELDEGSPPGIDFLASVAREWEASALEARELGIRTVICRFGIVLGAAGGALGQMLPLFRKGLGSPLGSGRQWVSWIHEKDLAELFLFLMEHEDLSGPFNCTAPRPVRNEELTRGLAQALGKRASMPAVPAFMVKLMKGEMGTILLKGQKVLPKRLVDKGFRFRFEKLEDALKDILSGPLRSPA